jgi:alpha-amylase
MYKVLQISDNFYYQSIKGLSDMSVHNYFSHFDTPFDAYASYLNILYDFEYYIKELLAKSEISKNNDKTSNDNTPPSRKEIDKKNLSKESSANSDIIVASNDIKDAESIYNQDGKEDKDKDDNNTFIIA